MNEQESKYFQQLYEKRKRWTETLLDYEARGVWASVIERYTDPVHFIYELLQNADDANATKVEIRLDKNGFLFKHNGTIHFTISDPNKAEEDGKKGKYGHLNALTGIGSSSKLEGAEGNKIGKFGIGFKSVFKYTAHPHVYDDIICFVLHDYIVPERLNEDHSWRQSGETLFYLPFDKPGMSPKESYSQIEEKLKTLENPILFLHHIQSIHWKSATNNGGTYSKELLKTIKQDNVLCEQIKLHNFSSKDTRELWMFTKNIHLEEGSFPISVGLYIKEGKIDVEIRPRIYCFFPTQESLDFCFIMHAPFALIDNRESIKTSEPINNTLFGQLAILSCDALRALRDIGVKEKHTYIDESIFQIVPLESKYAYNANAKIKWYNEFYNHLNELLSNEAIHRTIDGSYIDAKHAMKIDNNLRRLLSEDQVSIMRYYCDSESSYYWQTPEKVQYKFVHPNLALRRSESLMSYFKSIGISSFYTEDFVNNFTQRFIKEQDDKWLASFYHYLCSKEGQRLLTEPDPYEDNDMSLRDKPIIRTNKKIFVAPYEDGELAVFTPNDGAMTDGLVYVDSKLLSNPDFVKVLDLLGISTPDIHDIVENVIFPKYKGDFTFTWDSYEKDFRTIFRAYVSLKNDFFVNQVKENFWFRSTKDQLVSRKGHLYKDTDILNRLSADSKELSIIDTAYYKRIIPKTQHETLLEFFDKLQFEDLLSVDEVDGDYREKLTNEEIENAYGASVHCVFVGGRHQREVYLYGADVTDRQLEGFSDVVNAGKLSLEYSLLFWNSYKHILSNSRQYELSVYKRWECKYSPFSGDGRYNARVISKISSFVTQAHDFAWLYDKQGNLHKPEDVFIEDLAPEYVMDDAMIEFVGLQYSPQAQDLAFIEENCSESTKEAVLLGQALKNNGFTKEDIPEYLEWKKEKAKREQEAAQEAERKRKREEERAQLEQLRKNNSPDEVLLHKQNKYSTDELFDSVPQNLPATSSTSKQPSAPTMEQIEELQQQEESRLRLTQTAQDDEKCYTYEWFNTLLELEFRESGEATSSKSGLHIVFSKVEKDPHSERGVLLRNPSRYIPRSIEECSNITVVFYLPNDIHPSISFEVASVQDYVLRLKCKNEDVDEVDKLLAVAHQVYRAELKTETPIKLIQRLQQAFLELGYEDNFSMLDNINPNVKFIFGPPGTGKTTHLVKKWISKIATRPHGKMLVLCPTNKAADVIAQRALDKINPASRPETWLYRFVQTAEDSLEQNVCLRDSNVYNNDKCCVISTIARFAYDGFEDAKLKDIDWDYIVIDEASMIPLAEIIYPIYKCANAQIVIAGDPFQIEPIVSVDLWKDENIYKMIHLDNFKNPSTVPVNFDITNLTTQYRAVPAIGRLYSEYTYDGAITSDREQSSQRKLILKGFEPKSVNFVLFPVTNTSIYEPHMVVKSNVHIYSALFTYEFIKYLATNISNQQDDKIWRIGVISPYRAQAEVINKLWEQRTELYDNVDVQIGTVHGFQGDECDIIIAVYNPAAQGMKRNAANVFVNKKNILNVAISRAQDYLFLLMPDKDYENYNNLEAKAIGVIAKKNINEMTTTNSQILEKIMLGDLHYLDKNTFVTMHQLANIYSEPSSKYEVRFDERSVDIQINNKVK